MTTGMLPRSRDDVAVLRDSIQRHLTYSLGVRHGSLPEREFFRAVALAVRDLAAERMLNTIDRYDQRDPKRVYYLSMEFLIGRSLDNNLTNLGIREACRQAVRDLGHDLDGLEEAEPDAALGNGGLGRLAACFLDSMASLDVPGFGYGINYEYGLFKQELRGGEQIERPDSWRTYATPWEIERPQDAVLVPLYGRIEHSTDRMGNYNPMWLDWKVVIGVPHDMPIVGFGGNTVNYLRLYSARASSEVDMRIFNAGDYLNAVEQKVMSETISKVLYPSEQAAAGRELRLVQEYFLVACAVRDVVRRFEQRHDDFRWFPDKVAIQLNDTHPSLTVVELMRLLVDEKGLPWDTAWQITTATLAYTNHTLLPEALERWPVGLIQYVLPRHMQLIFEINHRFLKKVADRWPNDVERQRRMSLIEEGDSKQVRMAHLSIVGGHSVNGVAALHSQLLRTSLVPDFDAFFPEKFNNKTNGVTQRRWLLAANPSLASLLSQAIGTSWITRLDALRAIDSLADDADFQEQFRRAKASNKKRLAHVIRDLTGVVVDPHSLFDVQVKRIHEYKRQLLNLLHIVHEYLLLADGKATTDVARTYIFAGKAAPGYHAAKLIIRLINDVGRVVNRDPRVNGQLRVVFVPDYRVSLAEQIIPAADVSEQISTAGTEASGTGNMKFAMNGALTVGTFDGANIEMLEEVGADNFFLFGATVETIRDELSRDRYRPWEIYQRNESVRHILDAFRENRFCPEEPGRHDWVSQKLLRNGETYYHVGDLASYLAIHDKVSQSYRDARLWTAMAIRNVARMGKFSSDRTILEYAREIWNTPPVPAVN